MLFIKAFKVSRLPKHTVFSMEKRYLTERKVSPVRQSQLSLLHTNYYLATLL
ncbi:unnamed protein product [Staphylococcus haemolyticus JCSC1435]|uniref:Uncharacterized protein n=1 Tax=Staphylococcus haemolyticus (strain JCSC1435) TaxID=279808 RepID=Q4L4N3_STAHJ|nr:unnamed protein product [Staphylococcus haemolyticus JCSC1435]